MASYEQVKDFLHECVAGILALAVGVMFLVCAGFLLYYRAEPAASWQNLRVVADLLVGLVGSVFGFYFGSRPAEKAAKDARTTAAVAQQQTQDAVKKLDGGEEWNTVVAGLKTKAEGPRFAGRTDDSVPGEVRQALFALPKPTAPARDHFDTLRTKLGWGSR